jgi:UDP:flavonoid glycosyltransferase YjiC (YdhE family)
MFITLGGMARIAASANRKLKIAVGFALREAFTATNNIDITDWAVQTDILKEARSAVVHGGLATIKECIYFGIPPIVVPLGKDQMDNALRVVNKNVGSMVILSNTTAQGFYDAVMRAELNHSIQKALRTMRNKFLKLEQGQIAKRFSITYIKEALGIQA